MHCVLIFCALCSLFCAAKGGLLLFFCTAGTLDRFRCGTEQVSIVSEACGSGDGNWSFQRLVCRRNLVDYWIFMNCFVWQKKFFHCGAYWVNTSSILLRLTFLQISSSSCVEHRSQLCCWLMCKFFLKIISRSCCPMYKISDLFSLEIYFWPFAVDFWWAVLLLGVHLM